MHVNDTRHRTSHKGYEDQDPDDHTVFEDVSQARLIATLYTEVYDHVDSDDASGDKAAQTTEQPIDQPTRSSGAAHLSISQCGFHHEDVTGGEVDRPVAGAPEDERGDFTSSTGAHHQ